MIRFLESRIGSSTPKREREAVKRSPTPVASATPASIGPETWFEALIASAEVVEHGDQGLTLEALRRVLGCHAVVLRARTQRTAEIFRIAYDDATELAHHQHVVRTVELPMGTPNGTAKSPVPVELLRGKGVAAERWRTWGIRSLVAIATAPDASPFVRLEFYFPAARAIDATTESALRAVLHHFTAALDLTCHRDMVHAADSFVRRVTNAGPLLVHVYVPRRGESVYANARCEDFFAPDGFAPRSGEAVVRNRHPWLRKVLPEDRARLRAQLLRTEVSADGTILEGEYSFLRDHQIVRMQIWSTRIPRHVTGTDEEVMITALDVSRQRRLERHVANLDMQEREELGREIHDGVCQDLIGIGMSIDRLRGSRDGTGAEAETLTSISRSLKECLRRASAIAHGIRPVEISGRELPEAMQTLVFTTEQRFGVPCQLVSRGDFADLSNDVALQLYWIARESLLNAARHADARSIEINLRRDDRTIRCRVMDDGRGFDTSRPRPDDRDGMGLDILERRAELIGADLVIHSEAGAGTTVSCEIRMQGSDDDER